MLFSIGLFTQGCDCGDPAPVTLDASSLEEMADEIIAEKDSEGVSLYDTNYPYDITEQKNPFTEEVQYNVYFEYILATVKGHMNA